MPSRSPSKQRLEELIALARTYRGWTATQLARELGRDVHHLVPNSGVPKLDLVTALADALDWSVQDVVDDLCGNVPKRTDPPEETWAELDRAAYRAHCEGRFEDAIAIAKREFEAATSGDERARAYGRQVQGWDGLGSYMRAAEAAQRGLAEDSISSEIAIHLRNQLANAHYLLGRYLEAEGLASSTLELMASGELASRVQAGGAGFAHFVRGHARREMAGRGGTTAHGCASRAKSDLGRAVELLRAAYAESGEATFYDVAAFVAEGGLVEIDTQLGLLDPRSALDVIVDRLEAVVDPRALLPGGRLEGYGWWCVFGANIAARSGLPEDEVSTLMAVFTNKADEIADLLGNWALRERVWMMELARRAGRGDDEGDWLIDREDLRQISGAMARFPAFRAEGWRVLRATKVKDLEGGSP